MIDRRTALAYLAVAPGLLGSACRQAIGASPQLTAFLPNVAAPRLTTPEDTHATASLRSGMSWGGARHIGPKPRFRVANGAQCRGATLHDVIASGGPEWVVDCDSDASLIDSRIARISGQCGRGCIRLRGDSSGVVISDVSAQGSLVTDTKRLPVGIAFDGTAHDIRLERIIMRGFQTDWGADRYWNGDGFSSERGNAGLEIRDCAAIDNSDGGFDMKAHSSRFSGVNVAQGNLRNFRLWESFQAETLVSLEPVRRGGTGGPLHVGIFATSKRDTPITIRIARLIAHAGGAPRAPLFYYDDRGAGVPATVIVDAHEISLASGTPIVAGPSAARLSVRWMSQPPRL